MLPTTVLLRIEFTATDSLQPSGALLPHLSTLTSSAQVPDPAPHRLRQGALPTPRLLSPEKLAFFRVPLLGMRRYLSVALFLKSPSAGVTRYPCPVEPGLSSGPAFRPGPATVCLPRGIILQDGPPFVNGKSRRRRAISAGSPGRRDSGRSAPPGSGMSPSPGSLRRCPPHALRRRRGWDKGAGSIRF